MPSASAFLFGSTAYSQFVDLSNYTQVRILVNRQSTTSQAAAKLIARYRTSYSTTVGDFTDIGTSEVSANVTTQNAYTASSWINLAAAARTSVYLSIVGSGGNGSQDPVFGSVVLEFK